MVAKYSIGETGFEDNKLLLIDTLEKMLLARSDVSALTYKGIQRFVSGLSQAFGKSLHKGVWLQWENDGITADISIAVTAEALVYKTASQIQEQVKKVILQQMNVPVCVVNVIVTGIAE